MDYGFVLSVYTMSDAVVLVAGGVTGTCPGIGSIESPSVARSMSHQETQEQR